MSNRDLIERLRNPPPGNIYRLALEAATALQAHEWQPIDENTPKDTAIMIYSTGYAIGHFNTKDNRWWTNTDGTGTSEERLLNSWSPPTHWKHIQPPGDKDESLEV